MAISLGLYFEDAIPPSVAAQIRDVARVDRWSSVTVFELAISYWEGAFRILYENGIRRLRTIPDVVEQEEFDWRSPSDEWIGAIIGPECVASLANPASDFSEDLGEPCGGIVRASSPLLVDEPPFGQVACIGDEIIFSDSFLRFVGPELAVPVGSVVDRRGGSLAWKRIQLMHTCDVLANESVQPNISCALCRRPFTPRTGMWIGKENTSVVNGVARDALGFSHSACRHPIVASLDMTKRIDKLWNSGLAIEPIYSFNSPTAKLLKAVFSEINKLFILQGEVPSQGT